MLLVRMKMVWTAWRVVGMMRVEGRRVEIWAKRRESMRKKMMYYVVCSDEGLAEGENLGMVRVWEGGLTYARY